MVKATIKKAVVHKDFLGKKLALNDVVIFNVPSYHELKIGKVIKFTPKQIRVEYTTRYKSVSSTSIYSSQVVLVSGPDAVMYFLGK